MLDATLLGVVVSLAGSIVDDHSPARYAAAAVELRPVFRLMICALK